MLPHPHSTDFVAGTEISYFNNLGIFPLRRTLYPIIRVDQDQIWFRAAKARRRGIRRHGGTSEVTARLPASVECVSRTRDLMRASLRCANRNTRLSVGWLGEHAGTKLGGPRRNTVTRPVPASRRRHAGYSRNSRGRGHGSRGPPKKRRLPLRG